MISAIQYILGVFIALGFVSGLIFGMYYLVFPILIVLILLQIFISFCRFRFVNVILEIFILFLALLSFIPFLGVFFRILGMILAIVDLIGFRDDHLFKQQVIIRTYNSNDSKKKEVVKPKVKNFKKKKYKNASFTEK